MKKNKITVRMLTVIAVSSALAFLLQLIGSAIGLKIGGFLEIEFSDLPALITAFAYGPICGIIVELLKNLFHLSISSTGFVGELANFTVNGVFVLTAGIIYQFNKTKKGALLSMLVATITMVLAGFFVNLYIMLPLYMKSATFAAKLALTITTIAPFNLCKGVVISGITYFLYKRLSPIIKG